MKQCLKGVVFKALDVSGAYRVARRLRSNGETATILQYHSVSSHGTYRSETIAVSPGLFDRQMSYLRKHCTVITLADVVRHLREEIPFPRRATAITFDDGYRDNYDYAFPILRKHGISATFFITAGPVAFSEKFWVAAIRSGVMWAPELGKLADAGIIPSDMSGDSRPQGREGIITYLTAEANRRNIEMRDEMLKKVWHVLGEEGIDRLREEIMLLPEHLREMTRGGMCIGSHTMTHSNLPHSTCSELKDELERSKILLEDIVDEPIIHLAYPGGPDPQNPIFDEKVIAAAKKAGYTSGCTSGRGVVSIGDDCFRMFRREINESHGMARFLFQVERSSLEPIYSWKRVPRRS